MDIKLVIVFIATLIIDSFLFPTFFGFQNSLLSILILLAPILYMGFYRRYVIWSFVFAAILELVRGFEFGAILIPFAFVLVIMYVMQQLLDIRYTYESRFNISKAILASFSTMVIVYLFIFIQNWGHFDLNYISPYLVTLTAIEAIVLTVIFNLIFNKRRDYV